MMAITEEEEAEEGDKEGGSQPEVRACLTHSILTAKQFFVHFCHL